MKNISEILNNLKLKDINEGASDGVNHIKSDGELKNIYSPVDGKKIASVIETSNESYEQLIDIAQKSFLKWRKVPAPVRGDVVRNIGNELRENKDSLGQLVSYEMGKSLQEGLGEVQEMIDICDFAAALLVEGERRSLGV